MLPRKPSMSQYVLHRHDVCNFKHFQNISYKIFRYVYVCLNIKLYMRNCSGGGCFSCWWHETVSSNRGNQQACCLFPNMSVETQWNDIDRKPEELWEKPVPVTLSPPCISHELTQVRTLVSTVRGWRLANCSGYFVIIVEQEAEWRFCSAVILMLYLLRNMVSVSTVYNEISYPSFPYALFSRKYCYFFWSL
jgi:hypothetical protein